MFRGLGVAVAALVSMVPGVLVAQDEALRHAFEGQTVVVKIDMPGDDGGINLFPNREDPADFRKIGDAIKQYGASLRKGDEVTITKVHLKPKLIEFQLGGGGFGSFGDMAGAPSVPSTHVRKSNREEDLEKQRGRATGDDRKRIERRLDGERRDRQREESRRRDRASGAQSDRDEWIQARRLRSGSRFNLHYPNGVPPEAATPEAIMAALREYVAFPRRETSAGAGGGGARVYPRTLEKGMSEDDVAHVLGHPASRKVSEAAGVTMINSTYDLRDSSISVQFANGVLVKFGLISK